MVVGPRILGCSGGEGERKESEDKWCDGVVGWCRFGVKRNLSESMAEVRIENLGQMGFRFQGEETREREI